MIDLAHPKGVNFKELNTEVIGVGIQREQFIDYLNSLEADNNGWISFNLIKRKEPSAKGGYTHFMKLREKKEAVWPLLIGMRLPSF